MSSDVVNRCSRSFARQSVAASGSGTCGVRTSGWVSARTCPSRADTATRYKKRSACGKSTACSGGGESARIGAIVRRRPIQQPRSTIVPNPHAIELEVGKRAVTETSMHFLGEIAEPFANGPPRLRPCHQRVEWLTGNLFVRIPCQTAGALPGQPAGPRRSPQNASHSGNRIGIHPGKPQPNRAPKPLVVSQGGAAIRLRTRAVDEPVRSNPSLTRQNLDRARNRRTTRAPLNRGLQHRPGVTHPFVNPCESIRPARWRKKQRSDDDSTTMAVIVPLGRWEYVRPVIHRTKPDANHGVRQRPALEGELARTVAVLRLPSPLGSHTAPCRVMRPTRSR